MNKISIQICLTLISFKRQNLTIVSSFAVLSGWLVLGMLVWSMVQQHSSTLATLNCGPLPAWAEAAAASLVWLVTHSRAH